MSATKLSKDAKLVFPQVTWSSGEVNEVLRTHMHLYDFHTLVSRHTPLS